MTATDAGDSYNMGALGGQLNERILRTAPDLQIQQHLIGPPFTLKATSLVCRVMVA